MNSRILFLLNYLICGHWFKEQPWNFLEVNVGTVQVCAPKDWLLVSSKLLDRQAHMMNEWKVHLKWNGQSGQRTSISSTDRIVDNFVHCGSVVTSNGSVKSLSRKYDQIIRVCQFFHFLSTTVIEFSKFMRRLITIHSFSPLVWICKPGEDPTGSMVRMPTSSWSLFGSLEVVGWIRSTRSESAYQFRFFSLEGNWTFSALRILLMWTNQLLKTRKNNRKVGTYSNGFGSRRFNSLEESMWSPPTARAVRISLPTSCMRFQYFCATSVCSLVASVWLCSGEKLLHHGRWRKRTKDYLAKGSRCEFFWSKCDRKGCQRRIWWLDHKRRNLQHVIDICNSCKSNVCLRISQRKLPFFFQPSCSKVVISIWLVGLQIL